MTELTCPTCHTALRVARDRSGAIWVCEDCAGAAASLAVLRKRLKAGMAADFWRKVVAGSAASQRSCPSCGQSMRGFAMPLDGHTINLDLCKKCQFVWFDGGELEALPEAAIQEDTVSKEAWQRMSQAMFKIELQNEQNAGVDREVEKAAYWADTGWLVARLLLRLFLRV
jgi:Zn-finger nucleic acid-binding protein